MKLAEALLLRKQLAQKVDQLKPIKMQGEDGIFDTKTRRAKVSDEIDEVTITTSKIQLADITKEFDKYATSLRKLDAKIQEANWTAEIDFAAPEGMK